MLKSNKKISTEEIVGNLSSTDMQKLRMVARTYSRLVYDLDENDLMQEALVKIISGERVYNSNVDFLMFFNGVVKSLTYNHLQKKQRRKENLAQEVGYFDADEIENIGNSEKTAEEMLIESEHQVEFHNFLLKQCKGRKEDVAVLDGIFQSLRGKKLCEFAGINQSELATILKRIKRLFANYQRGSQ